MDELNKMFDKNELINIKRNMNLVKEKNISNDDYLKIQSLYQKALDYYLLNNSSIKNYDEKIENSNLDFGLIDDKMMNIHHRISYLNLKYIYLRNFLFIEKLSKEQLEYIYTKIKNNDYSVDTTLLEIVKATYKEVIKNNYVRDTYKEEATTCYGSVIPTNIVSSNLLVFCIHYGKNTKEYNKEEFWENNDLKEEFLKNIVTEMENVLSNELQIGVKVLVRDYVGE